MEQRNELRGVLIISFVVLLLFGIILFCYKSNDSLPEYAGAESEGKLRNTNNPVSVSPDEDSEAETDFKTLSLAATVDIDDPIVKSTVSQFNEIRKISHQYFSDTISAGDETTYRFSITCDWGSEFTCIRSFKSKSEIEVVRGHCEGFDIEKGKWIVTTIRGAGEESGNLLQQLSAFPIPTEGVSQGLAWQWDCASFEYEVESILERRTVRFIGMPEEASGWNNLARIFSQILETNSN